MSDSDESQEYPEPRKIVTPKEEPPAGTAGLALAEHYFGPLSSPVAATPAQWTTYTESRLATNAEYSNVFECKRRSINGAVAGIEDELRLDDGAFQKCISIIQRDDFDTRDLTSFVRIYSPTTPTYVDVHVRYHHRCRSFETEWFYSLGYKIHERITPLPAAYYKPATIGLPDAWHTREGWRSVCWGHYDDAAHCYSSWRPIEVSGMKLYQDGMLDLHEALFGPIEKPADDDTDAVLAYRRKLVATARLLFAAVGIRYKVACTDEETDEKPIHYRLEGFSDRWVARGIRAACGFQLSGDADVARRGQEERRAEAACLEDERDRSLDDSGIHEALAAAMMRFFS